MAGLAWKVRSSGTPHFWRPAAYSGANQPSAVHQAVALGAAVADEDAGPAVLHLAQRTAVLAGHAHRLLALAACLPRSSLLHW